MNPAETRPLSDHERTLAAWMLEHGAPEARGYLTQLDKASATLWRCPCGCASFNLRIEGMPDAPPGVHVLGDFLFGTDENLSGAFIYSCEGTLSGLEVYGLAGDAPQTLPRPDELRPFDGKPVVLNHREPGDGAA